MKNHISTQYFHNALTRDLFLREPTKREVLCYMFLLHTCRIVLNDQAKVQGNIQSFEAITARHAAELVALVFKNEPQRNYHHWYYKWCGEWNGYAMLNGVPPELREPLKAMQARIESHPWIERLEDDNFDFLATLDD